MKNAAFFTFCFLLLAPVLLSRADSQQIDGFNLQGYSEGGTKSWDIKGEKADISGNTVQVNNVDANAYGDEDANLKARHGTMDRSTGDVQLNQDVVITSKDRGTVMKTDSLQWQRQKDLVKTADPVTIEDSSMRVQGIGLEAHPSMKEATLKSDVMADVKTQNVNNRENRIQITSDGPMEVDQVTRVAVFTDNVVAIEATTGRKLKADRMEITFDEQTHKVKQIVCKGNVEFTQDNNVTHSDEMVYLADEQRIVLKGRPKLLIDAGDKNAEGAFHF